jgi:hypothetical protein
VKKSAGCPVPTSLTDLPSTPQPLLKPNISDQAAYAPNALLLHYGIK